MKKVQANRPSPSPRSLRALILEDNRQDVELMVALLKQVGYAVSFEVVDSLAHLRQQLARTDYDIILAAHNLRAWTAMDALEILKKSRKDIPFVVVAGTLGGLAAVECIKQGAADYVLKNRLQRLPVVVERVLRDKAHREDAAGLQEQIQSLSRFPAENPNPILRLQRDGTLIYANPSARPLLQLWGCEVGQRVPADWATLVADSIASGAGKEVEVACDQRVYSFILAPIQTAGYVNAYGRDITDRKREEEALRRSEASYRSLILGATYGIFRCDVNGKFLAVNPALVAMLGYESEADLLAANLVRDVIRDPEEVYGCSSSTGKGAGSMVSKPSGVGRMVRPSRSGSAGGRSWTSAGPWRGARSSPRTRASTGTSRSSYGEPRRWKRWVAWRAESLTTLTTC